jgi:hypothetical protein
MDHNIISYLTPRGGYNRMLQETDFFNGSALLIVILITLFCIGDEKFRLSKKTFSLMVRTSCRPAIRSHNEEMNIWAL